MSLYLSGSYQSLAVQAQQHLRNNEYDEAQEVYERLYNRLGKMKADLIERRPNLKALQLTAIRSLGDLAGLQGEYDKAITYYQKGLEMDPEQSLQYRRAIAQTKIDKGDVEDGLDELRALAVMNAGQPDPWIWLGLELSTHGDEAEAEVNLKRAAEMEDADPARRFDAYTYLHDLYREQDRLDEAEAAWKKAWEVVGSDIDDPAPLYQMYWEANDLEKARTWLSKEKNPLRAGFYRGLFAQAESNERRAQQSWKKTADLSPLQHDEGHEAWAEAALRVDYPPQLITYALREVTSRGQLNMRGAILLAIAEIRAGQLDAAEVALKAAVDINQRARPRQDFLSRAHWSLFDELVANEEIKARFRSYFEPQETEPAQQIS